MPRTKKEEIVLDEAVAEKQEDILDLDVAEDEPAKETISEEAPKEEPKAPKATPTPTGRRGRKPAADAPVYIQDDSYYTEYREISAEQKELMAFEEVRKFKERGTIVEGVVVAVVPNDNQERINIIAEFKGFNVVIPDFEFFTPNSFKDDYASADEKEKRRRKLAKGRAALGAKITFIIMGTEIDTSHGERNYVVIGSRTRAMAARQNRFFKGKTPVEPGSAVDASVISVGENYANLEVLGVECIVTFDQIDAFQFVSDCRDVLAPGDKLRVVIRNIYNTPDGGIKLNVSGADIGNRVIRDNISKLKKESSYLGTVRNYNAEGHLYTIITDTKSLITVGEEAVVGNEILFKGDRVTVTISNISPNMAWGTAKKLNSIF